jgi:hypothetical protein
MKDYQHTGAFWWQMVADGGSRYFICHHWKALYTRAFPRKWWQWEKN